MSNCTKQVDFNNAEQAKRIAAYEANVKSAIGDLIGFKSDMLLQFSDGKKLSNRALKAYNDLYDTLYKDFMSLGEEVGFRYSHAMNRKLQIADLMQLYFKHGSIFTQKKYNKVDPHRLIAASKLVKEHLQMQKTRWGGKIPKWERTFMPAVLFAMRLDKTGHIYNFIKRATMLLEESQQNAAPYKAAIGEIYSKVASNIDNVLATHGSFFDYSWTMVDPNKSSEKMLADGDGVKLFTVNNTKVRYLGSKEKIDGSVWHDVIDEATGERKLLTEADITDATIREGIRSKYTNDLMNDIMMGQVRHVVWKNKPTKEHYEYLENIMNKWNTWKAQAEDKQRVMSVPPEVQFIKSNGYTIAFTMIEDINIVQGQSHESYSAYILGVQNEEEKWGYSDIKKKAFQVEDFDMLRNGFYRATKYKNYGKGTFSDTGAIADFYARDWDFTGDMMDAASSYMVNQPHPLLINTPRAAGLTGKGIERRLDYYGIWNAVDKLRGLYDRIGSEIATKAKKEQDAINYWFAGKQPNILKVFTKAYGVKNAKQALEQLKEAYAMSNSIYIDDKTGRVSTPNSHFVKMRGKYFPVMYEGIAVDNMLDNAIAELEEKVENNPDNEELKTQMLHLQLTRARREHEVDIEKDILEQLGEDYIENPDKAILAQRTTHTKHRTIWTDLARRDKSAGIHDKYMDSVFYGFQKNNLMLSMLDMLDGIASNDKSGNMSQSILDWTINRSKIAMNDPSADSYFFGLNPSNENVAKMINKALGTDYDARGIDSAAKIYRSLASSYVLGAMSALGNNTQRINDVLAYGVKASLDAAKLLKDNIESKKWEAIIEHTGVDNVTNILMDSFAQGGDISMKDAAFLETFGFTPFQLPTTALRDYFRLLRAGRKAFAEKGIKQVDEALSKKETDRINAIKSDLRRIEEKRRRVKVDSKEGRKLLHSLDLQERRLSSESERRSIQQLRELYYDLMMSKKTDSNKIIEARFKRLLGEVSDTMLKRMIAYKLTFWHSGMGKSLFTFTEGEQQMRREAVIMALMTADRNGMLGGNKKLVTLKTKNGNVAVDDKGNPIMLEERFISPTAIRIARNAVANSMFGMSQVHLADGFIGAGSLGGLYKGYPINQMLHDKRVWDSFRKGSDNHIELAKRLSMALVGLSKSMISKGNKYDPSDPNVDHQAVAVLRFILGRVGMSSAAVLAETIPFLNRVFRSSAGSFFFTMIRGGENPAIGLTFRFIAKLAIVMGGDDDKNNKDDWQKVSWDVLRLIAPAAFTIPIWIIAKTYNWIAD